VNARAAKAPVAYRMVHPFEPGRARAEDPTSSTVPTTLPGAHLRAGHAAALTVIEKLHQEFSRLEFQYQIDPRHCLVTEKH